jgi:hypothetical protein
MVLTIPLAAFSIASVSAGPILGTAGAFAILGGGGVAVNGTGSVIAGSVGAYPTTSITGVIPTNYTIFDGTVQSGGLIAQGAQADLGTAITALSGVTPFISPSTWAGGDITLPPGYYSIGALTLTGTLTLDAEGNSNALWVFKESSTLTTASGSDVKVINDGSGAGVGVYWVMGDSANLGGTDGSSMFYGNILASTSITVGTSVTDSCGSLLTTTASVTLAGDDTIGTGCQGGGTLSGTTITPYASSVPEPGTFFFVAPGLAGLLFLRKRSR